MMFDRIITTSKSHGFFLFGARGTGKSTYVRAHYLNEDTLFIDLLNPDAEVDLVVERPGKSPLLVEIKSSEHVDATEVKSLEKIARDFGRCECLCLSRDRARRQVGKTLILPWQEGLRSMGL